MDRDQLAAVFYGTGPVPVVWATDCPVRFDVWNAFAAANGDVPPRRVDVILAINEEHGTRKVLQELHKVQMPDANPLASGSFVSAVMTLEELVRAVLPMTNLASLVATAQGLSAAAEADVRRGVSPPAVPMSTPSSEERVQERARQLVWLVRVLATVVHGARQPRESKARARPPVAAYTEAFRLLRTAVVDRAVTQAPGNPRSKVIDRRQRYPVVSVTLNRTASTAVTRSRITVKADAAEQLFDVDCSSIGWAVVDSGVDVTHPAFYEWWPRPDSVRPEWDRGPTRVVRCLDFVGARRRLSLDATDNGLVDWVRALPYLEVQLPELPLPEPPPYPPPADYEPPKNPHGTHVAGIIGAHWPEQQFAGLCPNIKLYDFRVLGEDGRGDEFSIVAALQAIRHINEQAGRIVIAGANVSLSVPHDVATHSCGWTPVCVEADRLVRSGVVVVTAAGNSGFSGVMRTTGGGYQTLSISDPGNADSVITVGSTHRSDPHRHGVSYFSGRGPTADGRSKPDLLAPGEDIDGPVLGGGIAAMHGTSQAAAHVSGAAAMLVARYRELLGRPERVKDILCSTATDLGREKAFQGSGLLDVLRAMQSI
ncbi:Subtilase family protein [Pedococcus dokdonensis]|uniref:Subtilase family protein n=1 Tax=Pedococcus dokdonensis TaxID=443156 RepID=A0A1H0RYX8_9MICO|nr:S8 family serine peptidase [Pedococcus dokdonensis]SDP34690.1 Subtilase family protein [Pedococcus dokdonensis]